MHYLIILYLTLPCFVANLLPVLAARANFLPKLNVPVDYGKTCLGRRLFGDHKTWRGFLVGILGAMLVALLQYIAYYFNLVLWIDFFTLNQFLLFGFLSGLGALAGDTIESFFKRRLNIYSGKSFFPFDQIDYIIGFLLLTNFLVDWLLIDIIFLLIFSMIMAPLMSGIGYLTNIKKVH
jgi:CDP-2,3-bis-(O-geranylgeranyl)-sn-glycerol synthase